MSNHEICWKFEVIEKISPLKPAKRHWFFAFSLMLFPSVFAISNHLEDKTAEIPLWLAILTIVCLVLITFWALNFYMRVHIVTLDEKGITYWSKEVIPWDTIAKISLSIEEGHPYLIIDRHPSDRHPRHVPLYLQNIKLFKKKLKDLVPLGHPICELYADIDIVTQRYDEDETSS
jgi:hypothetical protein